MLNRWPPDSVNSLVTPWAFSRRATRRPPWTCVCSDVSVLMARTLCAGAHAPLVGAVVEPLQQPERLLRIGAGVGVPRLDAQLRVEIGADDLLDRLLGAAH